MARKAARGHAAVLLAEAADQQGMPVGAVEAAITYTAALAGGGKQDLADAQHRRARVNAKQLRPMRELAGVASTSSSAYSSSIPYGRSSVVNSDRRSNGRSRRPANSSAGK